MFTATGKYVQSHSQSQSQSQIRTEHFTQDTTTGTKAQTTDTVLIKAVEDLEQVVEAQSKVLIKMLSNMGLSGIKAQLQSASEAMAKKDYESYANTMTMIAEMKTNAFS